MSFRPLSSSLPCSTLVSSLVSQPIPACEMVPCHSADANGTGALQRIPLQLSNMIDAKVAIREHKHSLASHSRCLS